MERTVPRSRVPLSLRAGEHSPYMIEISKSGRWRSRGAEVLVFAPGRPSGEGEIGELARRVARTDMLQAFRAEGRAFHEWDTPAWHRVQHALRSALGCRPEDDDRRHGATLDSAILHFIKEYRSGWQELAEVIGSQ